jgi:hypothetical protein
MSAPILWIVIPFIAGVLILLFLRERISPLIGGSVATILALIALIFPIDTALLIGSVSIKISPGIEFFGRSFALTTADGPLLAVIYGLSALWFFQYSQPICFTRINDRGLVDRIHSSRTFSLCRASTRNGRDAGDPITCTNLSKARARSHSFPYLSNISHAIHSFFRVDAGRRGSQSRRYQYHTASRRHARLGICLFAGNLPAL